MTISRLCFGLAAMALLAGCQTRAFPNYVSSRDSLFYLQQLDVAPVSVGNFTGGPEDLAGAARNSIISACAISPTAKRGIPADYHEYIRGALIEELRSAGLYLEGAAPITISGQIEEIGFGRGLPFGGQWSMRLRLTSSNGASLVTEGGAKFDVGALAGPTVCGNAIKSFAPAVRQVLEEAISAPGFAALLAR